MEIDREKKGDEENETEIDFPILGVDKVNVFCFCSAGN